MPSPSRRHRTWPPIALEVHRAAEAAGRNNLHQGRARPSRSARFPPSRSENIFRADIAGLLAPEITRIKPVTKRPAAIGLPLITACGFDDDRVAGGRSQSRQAAPAAAALE